MVVLLMTGPRRGRRNLKIKTASICHDGKFARPFGASFARYSRGMKLRNNERGEMHARKRSRLSAPGSSDWNTWRVYLVLHWNDSSPRKRADATEKESPDASHRGVRVCGGKIATLKLTSNDATENNKAPGQRVL